MKTIVDEGVTIRLVRALRARGVAISPFPDAWKGLKNGALLTELRAAGYECVVTCDQSLRHQQNLAAKRVALVFLPWTRFDDLYPLLASIQRAIETIEDCGIRVIDRDGSVK